MTSWLVVQVAAVLGVAAAAALAWQADNGDGTYRNPILFADYSDPDVVRVGDDYYMVASDFHYMPGLPVLHSRDLVNWTIIGHAFDRLEADPKYDMAGGTRHGRGCWAPAIRHHDGKFWVYFCTPDEGLFMTSAENPAGPWAPLTHVAQVAGWEDPCPLWDADGQAYLVRSQLGGGPLILHRMSPDGTRLLDEGTTIYAQRDEHRHLEGPKFYRRDGYYYILAPAGGVEQGYQVAFRSRDIYGPYEERKVLEQGSTRVNGPHQGGLVDTPDGEEWWFIHFQQRGFYGRIVHLQPVRWVDGWPQMGEDYDGNGVGEPVARHRKPAVGREYPVQVPQTSDDFSGPALGLQWQWDHNPLDDRWSLAARPGWLRLTAAPGDRLANGRNVLTQKIADPACQATAELDIAGMRDRELAGVCVFGYSHGWIGVVQEDGRRRLRMVHNNGGWRSKEQVSTFDGPDLTAERVFLRAIVSADAKATFAYSLDGEAFTPLGEPMSLYFDWWKGQKLGLFHFTRERDEDHVPGHVDVNDFRYQPLP